MFSYIGFTGIEVKQISSFFNPVTGCVTVFFYGMNDILKSSFPKIMSNFEQMSLASPESGEKCIDGKLSL